MDWRPSTKWVCSSWICCHPRFTLEFHPCWGQADLDNNEGWMLLHQIHISALFKGGSSESAGPIKHNRPQAVLVGYLVTKSTEQNPTLPLASSKWFSTNKTESNEEKHHSKLSFWPLLLCDKGYHPCYLGFHSVKKHLVGVGAVSTIFGWKTSMFPWFASRNASTKITAFSRDICIYCFRHLA